MRTCKANLDLLLTKHGSGRRGALEEQERLDLQRQSEMLYSVRKQSSCCFLSDASDNTRSDAEPRSLMGREPVGGSRLVTQ